MRKLEGFIQFPISYNFLEQTALSFETSPRDPSLERREMPEGGLFPCTPSGTPRAEEAAAAAGCRRRLRGAPAVPRPSAPPPRRHSRAPGASPDRLLLLLLLLPPPPPPSSSSSPRSFSPGTAGEPLPWRHLPSRKKSPAPGAVEPRRGGPASPGRCAPPPPRQHTNTRTHTDRHRHTHPHTPTPRKKRGEAGVEELTPSTSRPARTLPASPGEQPLRGESPAAAGQRPVPPAGVGCGGGRRAAPGSSRHPGTGCASAALERDIHAALRPLRKGAGVNSALLAAA